MTTHRLRQHVYPAMRTIYRQIRILNYRLVFFATETLAKAGFGFECPSCHNHTQGNRRQIVGLERDFDQNSKHITGTMDNCESLLNFHQLDADNDGVGDLCDDTPGCGGCGQPACETEC